MNSRLSLINDELTKLEALIADMQIAEEKYPFDLLCIFFFGMKFHLAKVSYLKTDFVVRENNQQDVDESEAKRISLVRKSRSLIRERVLKLMDRRDDLEVRKLFDLLKSDGILPHHGDYQHWLDSVPSTANQGRPVLSSPPLQ